MLVHSVFFWLRSDLSDSERGEFFASIETLRGIEAAEAVYIGVPAPVAERPVIEKTYDCGLTVLFADTQAHDIYQQHPVHQAFIAANQSRWTRVQVFDTL